MKQFAQCTKLKTFWSRSKEENNISEVIKLCDSHLILDSIVVSIPACHAGGRGSIPRRGDFFCLLIYDLGRLQVS